MKPRLSNNRRGGSQTRPYACEVDSLGFAQGRDDSYGMTAKGGAFRGIGISDSMYELFPPAAGVIPVAPVAGRCLWIPTHARQPPEASLVTPAEVGVYPSLGA